MIKYETNKQLNQFSRIYFEKSKINYSINEIKPIIIVSGEPNSIFYEIFLNLKKKKIQKSIIIDYINKIIRETNEEV